MDLYLLLTPFLMLIIISLLGFVGCHLLFKLEEIPDVIPGPLNFSATAGNNVVNLDWDDVSNADSYTVKRGETSGMYPIAFAGILASEFDDDTAVNGTTYFYVVTATVNGTETSRSEEREATPRAAALTSLVDETTLGSLRNNFTSWVGMGFITGGNALKVERLGRMFAPNNIGAHVVKLVDGASGTDLMGGSAIVSYPSGAVGQFTYGDLAATVVLAANSKYYLLSQESSGTDSFYDSADTSVTTTGDAVRVFAVFGDGMGNFTEAPIDDFVYGPVDLQYSL